MVRPLFLPMTIDIQDEQSATGMPGRARRRFAYLLILVLIVLLLAFIPPLVNVSRFQRRVDSNISAALGRPIHFDRLSLNLLPMPGFTLENFVIEEDPAFGYEPTLHADEVRINLRLSSLWRRRVEFSSISFTAPSVNLVHTADGRWNIQGLLLQASRIPAAPTAQAHAGPAPRFPYIEATGARVNLKLDQEKAPVALADADFALWQPAEHQWRLRLKADPVRTDIAPGDSGTLRVEGTLGGDAQHATLAEIPIDLHATWQDAQLGGLTSLLLGRDAGLRGDLAASIAILGTIGSNTITANLSVDNARRADFIPPHPLSIAIACRANAGSSFHSFAAIACRLPPPDATPQAMLALAASVPDVRQPELSSIRIDVPALPSQTLYAWLGVATRHPTKAFAGRGTLTGALEWGMQAQTALPPAANAGRRAFTASMQSAASPQWTGELRLSGEWLRLPGLGDSGAPLNDIVLRSTPATAAATQSAHPASQVSRDNFDLEPIDLPLGGEHAATLAGHLDDTGYTLHLTGSVVLDRLFILGDAIPQFGDGLKKLLTKEDPPASQHGPSGTASPTENAASLGHGEPPKAESPVPVSINVSATRTWGGAQVWTQTETAAPVEHHHHAR